MQEIGGAFLEQFVKLTFIAKASGLSRDFNQQLGRLQKQTFYRGRQEGSPKPTVDSVWLSNVISTRTLCF